ncbi:hypothetical protein Y1Q_0008877 [Alligator mississippiensis]|uniref:Uncharacterized protein n=1 Tax=Alligator mississippiensis TaxID=8496 RepID=A0A151NTU6_ALLMI|nr:hypothetical protein Y1Q_0008877 [Alligator mississippiensis]
MPRNSNQITVDGKGAANRALFPGAGAGAGAGMGGRGGATSKTETEAQDLLRSVSWPQEILLSVCLPTYLSTGPPV